jgi:hypothetical protein
MSQLKKPPVRIVTTPAGRLFRTMLELVNDQATAELYRNGGRVVLHVHGYKGIKVLEPDLQAILPGECHER